MTARQVDTICPRCDGFGHTDVWRGIATECRNCDGTGRVPVVAGWRPHEPERDDDAPPVIPMADDQFDDLERDYLLLCYEERLDTIQYDLNHAIESDAYAYVGGGDNKGTVAIDFCDPACNYTPRITPREARVLAARLLRAATQVEMAPLLGSVEWKFKTLEGVERVDLAIDLKGRKVKP